MKSAEITEHMVTAMASRQFDFLRCNFPNGDMVGHTGVLEAVITAMECVDQSLARILEAADQYGYTVLVTADHGNADQMTETKKGKTSIRTAHSLNPVPFIVYDKDHRYTLKRRLLWPGQCSSHCGKADGHPRSCMLGSLHDLTDPSHGTWNPTLL